MSIGLDSSPLAFSVAAGYVERAITVVGSIVAVPVYQRGSSRSRILRGIRTTAPAWAPSPSIDLLDSDLLDHSLGPERGERSDLDPGVNLVHAAVTEIVPAPSCGTVGEEPLGSDVVGVQVAPSRSPPRGRAADVAQTRSWEASIRTTRLGFGPTSIQSSLATSHEGQDPHTLKRNDHAGLRL